MVCLSTAGPYRESLESAGIAVHVAGFRGFRVFRKTWLVARDFLKLYRLVRDARPTIVHGFLFWAYILGAYVAWLARVPVFVSSRRSLGYHKARLDYRAIEWLANRCTRLVIANSEAVRQDTLRQEGLSPDMVRVIHNGLDLARFNGPRPEPLRIGLGLASGTPLVAVVSNFIHYKGHATFLDAWPRVVERHSDTVALLVGDGPTRGEYAARVDTMGLSESIRFLGTRTDIPSVLASIDALVHPSDEEGFSNAIIEAMAAGRPVVACEVGGNAEAIVENETGYLVPPRDPSALAAALIRLLDDAQRARALGTAGRARVEERFTEDRMIARYVAVYEELALHRLRK